MVADELDSLETSELILDFLKNKSIELGKEAGGKALQWVSAELLKAFGLGGDTSDLEQIKDLLNKVLENQKRILSKLDQLLLEVDFQASHHEGLRLGTADHQRLPGAAEPLDHYRR